MGAYIDGVRDAIDDIVEDLVSTYDIQPLRLAFVGYRDFSDAADMQFRYLDFTSSVYRFRNFVAATRATGGGDAPEDVMGGLFKALRLDWGPSGRPGMIFHIADAPAHGCHMHSYATDTYPYGDPDGRTPERLFWRLRWDAIHYYFGSITGDTATMLQRFAEANNGQVNTFYIGTGSSSMPVDGGAPMGSMSMRIGEPAGPSGSAGPSSGGPAGPMGAGWGGGASSIRDRIAASVKSAARQVVADRKTPKI
jgi:hypothetical protein